MRIRPARPDDSSAVFDLLTLRSQVAFGGSKATLARIEHTLALDGTDAFLAQTDVPVGYAALDATGGVEVASADADVVDPLLAAVLERARERAFETVQAAVVPEDGPFDAVVRRGGSARHGEVLRMWRDLDEGVADPVWPTTPTRRGTRHARRARTRSGCAS